MAQLAALLADDKALAERAREALRVGVHWSTEVYVPREDAAWRVCQVYASAVPVSYCRNTSGDDWAAFATLILSAAYDATLSVARTIAGREKRRVTVYLTSLGGGAFGNRTAWIAEALVDALQRHREAPLDVVMVNYGMIDSELKAYVDKHFTPQTSTEVTGATSSASAATEVAGASSNASPATELPDASEVARVMSMRSESGTLRIRAADAATDADAVFALVNAAYRIERDEASGVAFKRTDRYSAVAQVQTDMDAAARDQRFAVVLDAERDNAIVGAVRVLRPHESDDGVRCCNFGPFAVAPAAQQRGIGAFLLRWIEARARQLRAAALEIDVVNHRTDVIAYYQKRGFKLRAGIERPCDAAHNCDESVLTKPSHFVLLWKSLS